MQRIGVCSWSLGATGPEDLVKQAQQCGLSAVQLALDPLRTGAWAEREVVDRLAAAHITVLSGMMAMAGEDYSTLETIRQTGGVRLDDRWAEHRQAAAENAELARRLGVNLVTFHAGFLPHEPHDPLRASMIERLREISTIFAGHGVAVALETGQETAETLIDVLREINDPNIGVNFDPANMILYGMGDPVRSLRPLVPWVRQMHIKDAKPSMKGEWGTEAVAGHGSVSWGALFAIVRESLPAVNLVIEREAGPDRIADIREAVDLIVTHLPMASVEAARA